MQQQMLAWCDKMEARLRDVDPEPHAGAIAALEIYRRYARGEKADLSQANEQAGRAAQWYAEGSCDNMRSPRASICADIAGMC